MSTAAERTWSTARKKKASRIPKRPWSKEDTNHLITLHNDAEESITIAKALHRSREDVLDRIKELNLDADYEPDPALVEPVIRNCLACNKPFPSKERRICHTCYRRNEYEAEQERLRKLKSKLRKMR